MSQESKKERAEIEAAAYGFLGRRGYARGELESKLLARDFSKALVEEVLDTLEEAGYVDDQSFASHQGAILARKGWGPRQIEAKLRARGVGAEPIDDALKEIRQEEDFLSRGRARLESRFGPPGELNEKERQRAYRHLLYRGYSPALARRLIFEE